MGAYAARTATVTQVGSAGTRRRDRSDGGPSKTREHVITDRALIAAAQKANGFGKRAFDFVSALTGLLVLSPALITIAFLIWAQDGGAALYGHKRIGRRGVTFKCWKFRSMVLDGDKVLAAHLAADPMAQKEWAATQKLTDDPRVTRLGRFLRKTSLDELPQLWNVLVGQMSVIGPRPIVRSELDRYGKDRRYYLLVRPGITGLWQVSGRSSTTYARRVQLDRLYVENWSYAQEAEIMIRTPLAVFKGEGAI
jgi:exopolysaccharide production protein ExoY